MASPLSRMELRLRSLPIFRAVLAQLLVLTSLALLILLLARIEWRLPLWVAALLQGSGAALLGWRLGLSRWWLPINFAFVPGLLLAQALALPGWVAPLAFALLLLLNWNSARERVPLYLTGSQTRRQLQSLLGERVGPFHFVDLGCGLGSALCPLARAFPAAHFLGVETAPLSFLIAWLRSLPLRNCKVRYRSLWGQPLDGFEVVYCFLSPEPMPALWEKARSEMRGGSWLISNSFAIPGVPPTRTLLLEDWRASSLLLWEIPVASLAAADTAR